MHRRAASPAGRRVEVVVVDRLGESLRAAVRRDYPDVVLIEVAPGTTIPDMRPSASFTRARTRSG